jgi:sec-independent protein translocase protein TatA
MPTGWELVIILAVLLLLFGAKKLPDMARSVGQSARVFKGEMKGMKADDEARAATSSSDAPAPTPKAPPELPAGPPTAEPTRAADRPADWSAQPRTQQPGSNDPPR